MPFNTVAAKGEVGGEDGEKMESEQRKNKNKGDRDSDREGVALIASTTLPAGFKTGAERWGGETERLMGTEQGPVILRRGSYYQPCCLRAESSIPGVQLVPLFRHTHAHTHTHTGKFIYTPVEFS